MNDTDPRALLRYATWVVFKHKFSILVILIFTVACFAMGTFLITPQWKATAKLMVMQDPKQQMILFGDLQAPTQSDRGGNAMDLVEILNGNDLAQKIVTDFQLDERMRRKAQEPQTLQEKAKYWLVQAFNSPRTLLVTLGLKDPPNPNYFEKALDELVEDMEDIELIEETSTINVSIWADDRDLAVNICNAMVDYLVQRTKDFERSEAVTTYNFVTDQLANVEAALHEAEEDVFRFKEQHGIVELESERAMLLARHDSLTTQASQLKSRMAAHAARLNELEQQLGGPTSSAAAATSDSGGEVAVQSEEAAENNRYHKYRNAINERQSEQDILTTRVQLSEVRGEYDALNAELAAVQGQLDGFNAIELQSQRLQRTSTGLRERYMNLRSKQLALEVQKFTETSQFDIKVGDPAYIPPYARTDWPSWGVNLLAGLLFGVVFAFGQAFLYEYWRDSLHDAAEVQQLCGIEVLGEVRSVSLKRACRELTTSVKKVATTHSPSSDLPIGESPNETIKVDLTTTHVAAAKRTAAAPVASTQS